MTRGRSTRARSGPVVMGACRGLNLLLGIAAAPALLAGSWPLTLIPFTYIAAVTVVSRGEVHGGKRGPAALALVSLGGVVAALAAIAAAAGAGRKGGGWRRRRAPRVRVLPPFWRVYRDPAPAGIRHAVRTGVLSLVLVDATLAAAYAGPFFGAVVLATAVVAAGPGAVVCGYLRWTRSSRRYTSPFATRCTSPPVSFRPANALLRDLVVRAGAPSGRSRMLVVLDSGVERAHPDISRRRSPVLRRTPVRRSSWPDRWWSSPEASKPRTIAAHVERLLEAIHAAALCRHSYVVAVGGGAVLDVAGFAAATAHRGVRLIRVPDDGARAGRFRRRGEERRQRVREEELRRHVRRRRLR